MFTQPNREAPFGSAQPSNRSPRKEAYYYKAFISYKHLTSTAFAVQLERALMSYAKPLLTRPIRIFRDERYLAPGANLPKLIVDALSSSEFLILLASPEAAASSWVHDELERWCGELKRAENLIVILVKGQIAVNAEAKTVDWERTDALPPILCKYLERVPFYLDFAQITRAEDLTLADPEFKKAVNGITARFRNVDPNDMLGIEILQYRRNMRLRNGAIAALSTLTLTASIAAVIAVYLKSTAERNLAYAYINIGDAHWAKREVLEAEIAYSSALVAQDTREARERLLEVRSRGVSLLWRSPSRLGGNVLAYKGHYFFAGHHDGSIGIWNTKTHALIRRLIGHSAVVTVLALSPDGKLVASGDGAGRLDVWEVDTGAILMTSEVSGGFITIAFIGNSNLGAVVAGNRWLQWNVALASETLERQIIGDDIAAAVFDSIRSYLIVGDRKGIVRVLDVSTGEQLKRFTADRIPVGKVALSWDGNLLATWSNVTGLGLDPSLMRVKIWDLKKNALVQDIPGSFGFPGALAFSLDSQKLAIGQIATSFVLWDISEKSATTIQSEGIRALAFSSPSELFTVGEGFNHWDLKTNRQFEFSGHTRSVEAVAKIDDGKRIMTGSVDGSIHLWNGTSFSEVWARELRDSGVSWDWSLIAQIPDHSVLTKARKRWGKEVFLSLFSRVVHHASRRGWSAGNKIQVGASLVDANASLHSVKPLEPGVGGDQCH
jgi:WD40 repeat protein